MPPRPKLTWGLGFLVAVVVGGGAAADVVVDMPPPPPAASSEAARMPSSEFETQEALPTVGEIALHRYARARTRPFDTYFDPWSRRFFGGYAAPYFPPLYYPLFYRPFFPWGCGYGGWGHPFWSPFTFRVTGINSFH